MPEDKFWVVKCKICNNYHQGNPVMLDPGIYQFPMPVDGMVECPDNPEQTAEYWGSEWLALTKADLDSLLNK
jgi:hypothetical protein